MATKLRKEDYISKETTLSTPDTKTTAAEDDREMRYNGLSGDESIDDDDILRQPALPRTSGRAARSSTCNIDGIVRVKADKNAKDKAAGKAHAVFRKI